MIIRFSIKEFVFERVLIPLPQDVENEEFSGARITPHKVLVKLNVLPQNVKDFIRVHLLQIFNVHIVTINLTKEVCFEEDNLFGVRMQFGVEGEIARRGEPPWHSEEIECCWQNGLPLNETEPDEAQEAVVDGARLNSRVSLHRPVKRLAIFVQLPFEGALS